VLCQGFAAERQHSCFSDQHFGELLMLGTWHSIRYSAVYIGNFAYAHACVFVVYSKYARVPYSAPMWHLTVMFPIDLVAEYCCCKLLQGVCGWLLFGEHVNAQWWGGASLIIVGVLLVTAGVGRAAEPENANDMKGKAS
jgi:hypothetical protein